MFTFNPEKRSPHSEEGGNVENNKNIESIDQKIADLQAQITQLQQEKELLMNTLSEKQEEYGVSENFTKITPEMETLKNQITQSMKCEWPWWDSCDTTIVDPLSIDWSQTEFLARSITLNPETILMPYNPEKPYIPDLSTFHGKTFTEVLTYVQKIYGKTHYLPGLELNEYYTNNPDKIPENLKGSKLYILPGSSIGDSGGDTCFASGEWNGSKWDWVGFRVGNKFDANVEVVLFER